MALAGEIGDFAWPKKWVAATQKELGGLHILINNASIQMEKRWEDLSPEEIRKQWDANWIAPLLLCQLAAPIFRRQNWGRIINIGSIQQRQGNPVMTAYSATKAALENLTTGLAADLAKDGITANTIAPGFFNTYRNRHMFKNGKPIRDHSDWIPAGRVGEPRDAGGIALLLCSEEGSYITGQTIFVDGGLSVR
jgi:glucose 1-dehydrogenase